MQIESVTCFKATISQHDIICTTHTNPFDGVSHHPSRIQAMETGISISCGGAIAQLVLAGLSDAFLL